MTKNKELKRVRKVWALKEVDGGKVEGLYAHRRDAVRAASLLILDGYPGLYEGLSPLSVLTEHNEKYDQWEVATLDVLSFDNVWKQDNIQFPRLLSALRSTILEFQLTVLSKQVGLSERDVAALLHRADIAWDSVKKLVEDPEEA